MAGSNDKAYLREMRDILSRMDRQSAEDRKQAAEDRKEAALDRKQFVLAMLHMGNRIEAKLDGIAESVQDTNQLLRSFLKSIGNGRSGNGQHGRR